MARLKFSLHPLFILFGIYFAFTGKVFSFLVYTLCAVIHEIGHYVQSEKLGYALNKIVLMPYGAIIKGDIDGVRYKDEILISLAGPFYNFIIAVFCVALWWVFPDVYPYTDIIVTANLALLIINLLPCYPLDGGRFLLATLSLFISRKTARKIVKGLGVTFALIILGLFIYSIFTLINFTLLFFACFMLVGVFSSGVQCEYIKIYQNLTYEKPTSPKLVKKIVVSGDSEIRRLYDIINCEYYYEILVELNDGNVILEGERLYSVLSNFSPYDSISYAIKKEGYFAQ